MIMIVIGKVHRVGYGWDIYCLMLDRKLIAAFKSFVEKVFLPVVKKTDPCFLEWNKFSHMLTN